MAYQDWYSLHLLWSYSIFHASIVSVTHDICCYSEQNRIGKNNCVWLCELGLWWVLCEFLRQHAYLIICDLNVHVQKLALMGHALRCDAMWCVLMCHNALSFQVIVSIHCEPAFTYYHESLLKILSCAYFVTFVTLGTYAQKIMHSVAFVCVCVCVCTRTRMWPKTPIYTLIGQTSS